MVCYIIMYSSEAFSGVRTNSIIVMDLWGFVVGILPGVGGWFDGHFHFLQERAIVIRYN